jgi:AAA family ATP:ADP antiporter
MLRAVDVRRREAEAVAWSCAHFFCLMAGYYVIQPIRDAMGLARGVEELMPLFLVTVVVMFVANPIFSGLVSCYSRRVFVPVVYVFCVLNLLLFYVLFRRVPPGQDILLARAFFVWVSVFNLVIVSLFWATMADLFSAQQGKRLFGVIAVGGTFGAIFGAASTATLAQQLGEVTLLPVSAGLLIVACLCGVRLSRMPRRIRQTIEHTDEAAIGGGLLAGMTHVVRSPFLIGICLFIFFLAFTATCAYFAQAAIVENSFGDRDERAATFAAIALWVNVVTALIQVFLTGRVIRSFGVGGTLALLPLVAIGGFVSLAMAPTLATLVVVQVLMRGTNFSLVNPARESLFTVISREDKYKAKNLVDTFIYRAGDAVGATVFLVLTSVLVGLRLPEDLPGVLLTILPLLVIWLLVALRLGRAHQRLAGEIE